MNRNLPIVRDDGYRQDGNLLDRRDMLAKIRRSPDCQPSVSAARSLSITADVLGGIGGALIGIPTGDAIVSGGYSDAGLGMLIGGASTISLGLVLALVADGKVSDSVDCFNQRFPEEALRPGPRRHPSRRPADETLPEPPSPLAEPRKPPDAKGEEGETTQTVTATAAPERRRRQPLIVLPD